MDDLRKESASVPGKVILDHTIPRMEYQGLRLKTGQVIRVIDIEGEQVMDTVTLNANDPSEHSSMPWSNFLNKTWRLKKGHVIYSIRCNPMFKIVEDTVGLNYSGSGFCTAESNFMRYGVPHTRNCGDNLAAAFAKFGIPRHYSAESGEKMHKFYSLIGGLPPRPDKCAWSKLTQHQVIVPHMPLLLINRRESTASEARM